MTTANDAAEIARLKMFPVEIRSQHIEGLKVAIERLQFVESYQQARARRAVMERQLSLLLAAA